MIFENVWSGIKNLFSTEVELREPFSFPRIENSKDVIRNLKIDEEKQYENLFIKILKCRNSEFDDNPEVTAYLQVRDITMKDNDKVFIFNGWTFSSSPSIRPFDHPVYDIWLLKCF